MKTTYRLLISLATMTCISPLCVGQQGGFVDYSTPNTVASSQAVPSASASLVNSTQNRPSRDIGSFWPRPYAYGGLGLSHGAGYSPAAGILGSGLDIDNSHFLFLAEGSIQNDHKLDSGTGTEYALQARSFARAADGWYFGGGAQWSKLSTSEYAKQAWRPTFGGGKDIMRENFSMRAQAVYILPGTDHLNAVQGPEVSLWLPSPASKSHFFYRQTVGIYEFHQTSVPGNPGTNVRMASTFVNLTAMYRF
jgi:hypothetical protein